MSASVLESGVPTTIREMGPFVCLRKNLPENFEDALDMPGKNTSKVSKTQRSCKSREDPGSHDQRSLG